MPRVEHDLLGAREVPDHAYWGVHTLRAVENFPVSGETIGDAPDLIAGLASVKAACTRANQELGVLDDVRAAAIDRACLEIRAGALHREFVVDLIQGGAGTSTNMNANEVIANRALELLGRTRGDYEHLHPNQHVNLSQSTNDVYPTAVRLALLAGAARLKIAVEHLSDAFGRKAEEYADVVKIGRTQLQDAVPMTLGQELAAFRWMLREDLERIEEASGLLHEVNLGGTAIGTRITSPPGFAECAVRHLAALTELPVRLAPNLIEATQDTGVFVAMSGTLKRLATKLIKICNDLRLLSSGPQAGLGELRLPPMQAGSSIMPGKVNPVIPEVVNQIAFQAIGNDLTVTLAAQGGQLQLNPFEPIIFRALRESISHLTTGCQLLADRCVVGIETNRELLTQHIDASVTVCTALVPVIGYAAATGLAQDALTTGRPVTQLALDRGLVTESQLAHVLMLLARPSGAHST